METYVPTTPGDGILGAQTEGQLDGIQAWKKGMKEKEKKGKEGEHTPAAKKKDDGAEPAPQISASTSTEGNMDEIQLFKLMMKAAKKEPDQGPSDTGSPVATLQPSENGSATVGKQGHREHYLLTIFLVLTAAPSRYRQSNSDYCFQLE